MEDATTDCAAFAETVVFLGYFKDLKDPRQQGKVTYPLDEILLLCLLAVLAGAKTFSSISPCSAARNASFCAASVRSRTAHQRTTISATSWRCSTPSNSRDASSPGSRH
jgi:hypothetical protein